MGVGIEGVVAEVGIVGGEGDVATAGEFEGVVQVGLVAKSGGLAFADASGLVEAEHGGVLALASRQKQVGGDAVLVARDEDDLAADESAIERHFVDRFDHGRRFETRGQGAHDGFEAGKIDRQAEQQEGDHFTSCLVPSKVLTVWLATRTT